MGAFQSLLSNLVDAERNDPVNQLVGNSRFWADLIQSQSQQLWEREDTAYQRMVKDMEKAGLNPWTGVSSGGLSAGSNIPSMDSLTSLLSILNTSISNKNMKISGINAFSSGVSKLGNLFNNVVDTLGRLVGNIGSAF